MVTARANPLSLSHVMRPGISGGDCVSHPVLAECLLERGPGGHTWGSMQPTCTWPALGQWKVTGWRLGGSVCPQERGLGSLAIPVPPHPFYLQPSRNMTEAFEIFLYLGYLRKEETKNWGGGSVRGSWGE